MYREGKSNTSFFPSLNYIGPWTLSSKFMDKVNCLDCVHGLPGFCPWTPWSLSTDIVQSTEFTGHCPDCSLSPWTSLPGLCPWTMSSPPGFPGHFPEFPWTLSRLFTESLDSPSGTSSMDIVQSFWFPGHFPKFPWTLSRLSTEFTDHSGTLSMDIVQFTWIPWTFSSVYPALPRLSTESMEKVQRIHGKGPENPRKKSRESIVQRIHGKSPENPW